MARRQTSVLVSSRAVSTLEAIAEGWSVSRDSAARRLLDDYLEAQSPLAEDQRLTHISIVLRYPARPLPGHPDLRVRLPIRLDPGVDEAVVAIAFRFPGQARRQAHRDYAARPLVDALVTAIAMNTPFVDEGLEGLPTLMRQCEAIGLWRLVVAATRTEAERRVLHEGSDQASFELREGSVAWHSPWRWEVALHMARRLFLGDEAGAQENLGWLGEQGDELEFQVSELERVMFGGHELTEGAPTSTSSMAGRGGSAVWRAQRAEALEGLASWLTTSTRPTCMVSPPGWTLRMPSGWRAYQFSRTATLPPAEQAYVVEGRVLRIDHRGRSALWPMTPAGEPIEGFDRIIAGAGRAEPLALAEAVLVPAMPAAGEGDFDVAWVGYPSVPAVTAHEVGFISESERDTLTTDARQLTQDQIERAIQASTGRYHALEELEVARLREAYDDPPRFARLAAEYHLRFWITKPTWTWEIGSVAAALEAGATREQLRWLGKGWFDLVRRKLERDMEQAWFAGFHLTHGYRDEDLGDDWATILD